MNAIADFQHVMLIQQPVRTLKGTLHVGVGLDSMPIMGQLALTSLSATTTTVDVVTPAMNSNPITNAAVQKGLFCSCKVETRGSPLDRQRLGTCLEMCT
ncbi:hypothetical protein DPMN_181638 [Dreissena polymorpha]|uniref:Uncharacterized protein n=1 Tax=Dreissena polymorpha TaxID=45954 RepID=A0A9D4DE35_DREPO|nr:hypothetical protein DPMN_181638 [Dreissena polymorpha]